MSPSYPDVVREWAAERVETKAKRGAFTARVARFLARLNSDKLLDVIRVF